MTTTKLDSLLHEIDALIDDDETADRRVSGAWKTFADITAAAQANAWDAYALDLSVDAASYRALDRRDREALRRVFGTIYCAESVVDDWMPRIVAAIPPEAEYASMRVALQGQEHDEKMHRDSLFRVGTEVLDMPADEVDELAQKYNNVVAETLFARFERQMAELLRPGRALTDVYTAIFIYGILSEDVVANSDVVIRRAKGNAKYDEFNLPGMKLGQTNVRRDEGRHVRIAVLATDAFIRADETATARLLEVSLEYLDLADRMLRLAKRSHGLIDEHLAESYGSDVDSLYYYVMNMKRFAVRLDELGLREGVSAILARVDAAVAEFTDDGRTPVVERPGFFYRRFGPALIKRASASRSVD